MILALLMVLLAQPRQTEHEEVPIRVCPTIQRESPFLLPENTICWPHVERRLYDLPNGTEREAGVDGYRVEVNGEVALDIPWDVYEYESGGVTHYVYKGKTSFSPMKHIPYDPGVQFEVCVRSWTNDLVDYYGPAVGLPLYGSEATCRVYQWEWWCPPQYEGDDSNNCNLWSGRPDE